jgi:uncharacterized protein YcsI (UPF0317 family)
MRAHILEPSNQQQLFKKGNLINCFSLYSKYEQGGLLNLENNTLAFDFLNIAAQIMQTQH